MINSCSQYNDIQSLHAITENNWIKMIKLIFNYCLWAGNISLFEQLKFDAIIEDCIIKSVREKNVTIMFNTTSLP